MLFDNMVSVSSGKQTACRHYKLPKYSVCRLLPWLHYIGSFGRFLSTSSLTFSGYSVNSSLMSHHVMLALEFYGWLHGPKPKSPNLLRNTKFHFRHTLIFLDVLQRNYSYSCDTFDSGLFFSFSRTTSQPSNVVAVFRFKHYALGDESWTRTLWARRLQEHAWWLRVWLRGWRWVKIFHRVQWLVHCILHSSCEGTQSSSIEFTKPSTESENTNTESDCMSMDRLKILTYLAGSLISTPNRSYAICMFKQTEKK